MGSINSDFHAERPWGRVPSNSKVKHVYLGELFLLLGPKSRQTPMLPLALLFEAHTDAGPEIWAKIRRVARKEILQLHKSTRDLIAEDAGIRALVNIWNGSLTNLNRIHLMDLARVFSEAHAPGGFGDRWPDMPKQVLLVKEIKNEDITMSPRYDAFFEGRRHWLSL